MARQFAKLERIDNNEPVTPETYPIFVYHLYSTLLLALREQGRLSPMQHRHAEESLRQQRREHARWKQGEP